jgi:hypothetical protein
MIKSTTFHLWLDYKGNQLSSMYLKAFDVLITLAASKGVFDEKVGQVSPANAEATQKIATANTKHRMLEVTSISPGC